MSEIAVRFWTHENKWSRYFFLRAFLIDEARLADMSFDWLRATLSKAKIDAINAFKDLYPCD